MAYFQGFFPKKFPRSPPKCQNRHFGKILGTSWEDFGKPERSDMRKEKYKGRAEKRMVEKCVGLCVTYDGLHKKLTDMLSKDGAIKEFRCNVLMEGAGYTSDVVATAGDGHLIVYECVYRKTLIRPSVGKLLDMSRDYWLEHGVLKEDWRLVIDGEESTAEESGQ